MPKTPSKLSLAEALDLFLIQLEADGRSPHTIAQYRRHVCGLIRWCERGQGIEALGHQTVAQFLASPDARLRPDGQQKKASSVNCLRSSLRGFFGYCHQAGLVRENPARLLRRARTGPPLQRVISEGDLERLLDVLRREDAGRDYMLFHFLAATGARLSSALAVETGDVDLERAVVSLRRSKGDTPYEAVLGEKVRTHLRDYVGGREPGPLFPGRNGRPLSSRQARRRLRYWLGRAGVQKTVSPHGLRHAHGRRVYRRSGDLLVTAAALGHRSLASTVTYARVSEFRLRGAVGGDENSLPGP